MGTAQAVLSKCQHCKEHGTDFCYDCKKVLCGTCRTDHDKHTNINNHYVVPLRYVNNQILKTNLNCDKHDKKFELFCKTCDILVCSECVIASHPQHEFCCLSSTVKEAEKDLTALHTKLQEKRNILSSLITKIKSDLIPNLQKEKEAIRQNMINTVCTLQAAIDNVKVIEEERNDESYTAEEDRLNTTTKDVERLCNIYDSAINVFKEASNEKHPVAFFMVYKSVKNNVHSLEEIIDTVEDGHIPAFDNTEFTHKVINTMLLNLNESKLQDRDNTIKKLKATKEKLTKEVERMELEMKRTKLENEKTIKELQQKYDRISSMELEMKKTKTEYEKTVKEMQQKNDKLLSMELEMKRSKTEHEKAIKELQQKNDKLLSMQLELKKTKTAHEKNMKEMQQKYDKLLSKLQERDDTIGKLKEQEDYLTKTDASLQNDREVIPKTIMELKQRSDQLECTPTKATPKKTIKEMLRHSRKPLHDEYHSATDNSLSSDADTMPSIFGNNYLLPHTTPSLNGLPFFKADKLLKKTKR